MSNKPPGIVIPGMNRGAGVPAGYVLGRAKGTGHGPVRLLNLTQLAASGLATKASVVGADSVVLSTVLSELASLSTAISGGGADDDSALSSAISSAVSTTSSISTVVSAKITSLSTVISGSISSANSRIDSLSTAGGGADDDSALSTSLSSAVSINTTQSTSLSQISSSLSTEISVDLSRINSLSTAIGSGGSGITINAQTGTTYTFVAGDLGKLVTFSNASAIAVTLPQATGSFTTPWYVDVENKGASNVTITPTTSTIQGLASLVLVAGASVRIISNGTNYICQGLAGFYGSAGKSGLSLQAPDSGTTGGSDRGNNSIDLQTSRANANQVAAADNSFIGGGLNNRVTGGASSILGGSGGWVSGGNSALLGGTGACVVSGGIALGFGDSVTVSGDYSFGGGRVGTIAGRYSLAWGYAYNNVGYYSTAFGQNANGNNNQVQHSHSYAGGICLQERKNVLGQTTTGATAVRLTADGGAASTTNTANLSDGDAFGFIAVILIRNHSAPAKSWTYYALGGTACRDSGAASTVVSATVILGGTTGTPGVLAADPTITADTTNGGINVSYTPPIGNTDRLQAVVTFFGAESIGN